MNCKKERYFQEYEKNIFCMDAVDLTEQQKLCANIYKSGAFFLWLHLRKKIVRSFWKDHKNFPLKEKFYDKNLLVCCMSVRNLAKKIGVGVQKTQKLIKELKEAGWIKVDNKEAARGQNIFILGSWFEEKNEKGEVSYFEKLYENEIKSGKRISPILKQEKYDKMPDLTELNEEEFKAEMTKIYGERISAKVG